MPSLDECLREALAIGASDLHFDPAPDGVRVRARVDGVLRLLAGIDAVRWAHDLRATADWLGLRIDGGPAAARWGGTVEGQALQINASLLPTLQGPRLHLRLLPSSGLLAWSQLFWRAANASAVDRMLRSPSGLLLLAGVDREPVASALLARVAGEAVSAFSIEDPCGPELPWVAQVQVDAAQGLTHERLLTTVAKQDVDVLLISELPSHGSAELALTLAQSGHLVIAGDPSVSGLDAVARLIALGASPLALGAALAGAVGVRWVRGICPHCAGQFAAGPASALMALGLDGQLETVTRGRGCEQCRHSGLAGRLALLEVVEATQALRDAVGRDAPRDVLEELAFSTALPPLRQQAAEMVTTGLTTPEEAQRALG